MSNKITLVNSSKYAIQLPGHAEVIKPMSYGQVEEEVAKHPNVNRVLGKLLHICPQSADVNEFIDSLKKTSKNDIVQEAADSDSHVDLPDFTRMNKAALLAFAAEKGVEADDSLTKAQITEAIVKKLG